MEDSDQGFSEQHIGIQDLILIFGREHLCLFLKEIDQSVIDFPKDYRCILSVFSVIFDYVILTKLPS